ncbi:Lrp/AsnC family transcriptional regulator [Jatrophihabitans sp.]|uniref:Lrp/AsnC family transcriptional regulator n=1 Tax=Jatrophihabitans sp. TaxID=1932789 RepID=UPI002B784DA3|nr:Lrp/AsnC family transcriptional regulator [Jatrophihabitans sp.]
MARRELDALDVAILVALRDTPRAGYLELSRLLEVSRATVQARLERLERDGVVSGYGPDVDLAAAGYPVLAFATLEIAQGRLAEVTAAMAAIPSVVEAYATTGPGDVHCRLAASSHEDLQRVLLEVSQIPGVARSTSVIALTRLVQHRPVELLAAAEVPPASRTGGTR